MKHHDDFKNTTRIIAIYFSSLDQLFYLLYTIICFNYKKGMKYFHLALLTFTLIEYSNSGGDNNTSQSKNATKKESAKDPSLTEPVNEEQSEVITSQYRMTKRFGKEIAEDDTITESADIAQNRVHRSRLSLGKEIAEEDTSLESVGIAKDRAQTSQSSESAGIFEDVDLLGPSLTADNALKKVDESQPPSSFIKNTVLAEIESRVKQENYCESIYDEERVEMLLYFGK